MYDGFGGSAFPDRHHQGVHHEISMNGIAGGPPDDFAREQVQNNGQVEPTLPNPDISDVGDPDTIGLLDSEIAPDEIRDQLGWLTTGNIAAGTVAAFCTHAVDAHQPGHAMLAGRFAGLSKVEKDSRGTVHALARVERRPNQADQSLVLAGPIRNWHFEPRVVAAWPQRPATDTSSGRCGLSGSI